MNTKKDFYNLILKDRFPIASAKFSVGGVGAQVLFYSSPLGTILVAMLEGAESFMELNLCNRGRNKFGSENLTLIDNNTFAGISRSVQIEDILGKSIQIKVDEDTLISKIERVKMPLNAEIC